MKAVLWSINKPHTDNIRKCIKWDEIRKRIPKDLTEETVNYIYETKKNGGCGKVIGEFKVPSKTFIYAYVDDSGEKHLGNTAFIMPAISDEDLFKYLYDGKNNGGWALRIYNKKFYDKPKELSEFMVIKCINKKDGCSVCDIKPKCLRQLTRPPQSWQYVEEL